MKTSMIRSLFLLCGMVGLLSQVSCLKEEDELLAPRIFRPIPLVDNSIDNVLIVYFKSIEGAEYYQADISQDSSFFSIEKSITVDPDTADIYYGTTKFTHVRFNDLLAAQDYYIRVKAIHADTTMNSEYFELQATTLSIFVDPTINEILDVAFKAKWDRRGELVTKIRVKDAGTDEIVVQVGVSPFDNENGIKIIQGLSGGTTYNVFLYSGDILRGKGTVSTRPAIEGNIVDLRSYESSTILWDTISKVESGGVVLLKRGKTYTFPSSRIITGSITIRSGYDFIPDLAFLEFDGNPLNAQLNSNIDSIVFIDIAARSTFGGSSNFFMLENCDIGSVKFHNVRSQGHRGFFRVSDDAVVQSLTIDNCIIDSCREYGIAHIGGIGSYLGDISVKNSTFYYIVKPFYNQSDQMSASNTVSIENCTFFDSPDVGRYFFDYTKGSQVEIKNCIFGRTTSLLSVGDTTRGYRADVADLTISTLGCYFTNDFISASSPLPDLLPYNGSSFDLFTDPEKHNFKIKDSGFAGRSTAGDPRWW